MKKATLLRSRSPLDVERAVLSHAVHALVDSFRCPGERLVGSRQSTRGWPRFRVAIAWRVIVV